jgi:uncharacterized protein (TIGR00369 family)
MTMTNIPAPHLRETGVVDLATMKSISGLDFIRGMIEGRFPPPPISKVFKFYLGEADFGRAVFTCTPTFDHYNPIGSVHGGLAGTLLDSCMGCAVQTTLPAGKGYTTLEYRVHLVRGMTDKTGPVRAEGVVVHGGRQVATAEGKITDAAGRLLAHGTTTCLIFDLP